MNQMPLFQISWLLPGWVFYELANLATAQRILIDVLIIIYSKDSKYSFSFDYSIFLFSI